MPVMSYLATTSPTEVRALEAALRELPGCEVHPSDRGEVLVVVTDAPDEESGRELEERLRALPHLDTLVLVSAFADPQEP